MTCRAHPKYRRSKLATLVGEAHAKQMLRTTHHGAALIGAQCSDRKLKSVRDSVGFQDLNEGAMVGAVPYQAINGLEAARYPQFASAKNRTSNGGSAFCLHRIMSQLPPSIATTEKHRTATVELTEVDPDKRVESSFVISDYLMAMAG